MPKLTLAQRLERAEARRAKAEQEAARLKLIQKKERTRRLSTAAEKCARWRRKSVPVGLIKKGPEALLIDARCEPREA